MDVSKGIGAVVLAVLWLPAAAHAQARVPDAGMMAVGGEAGFFLPSDDLDAAPIIGGLFEYYPVPRLGLRGSVMFTNPSFDFSPEDHARQTRLGFDVIYNWERGQWHPFAGAGLGAHLVDIRRRGDSLFDDSEVGLSLLGGVEYFFNRRTTFKIEGRLQFVGDVRGADPSGFAATFGVKRYF